MTFEIQKTYRTKRGRTAQVCNDHGASHNLPLRIVVLGNAAWARRDGSFQINGEPDWMVHGAIEDETAEADDIPSAESIRMNNLQSQIDTLRKRVEELMHKVGKLEVAAVCDPIIASGNTAGNYSNLVNFIHEIQSGQLHPRNDAGVERITRPAPRYPRRPNKDVWRGPMIVTEEEAKTKWCPETRTGLNAGMSVNHHVDMEPGGQGVHDETRCIGSGCMMWRWQDSLSPVQERGAYGYCGKAGHP